MEKKDYIKWIRSKIGHERIILTFAGGELKINDDESLELKFFPIDEAPELFCKQHQDLLEDIKNKRYGVYR